MKIVPITAIAALALPFIALGQTTEEPQQTQGQTQETQSTAPAKGKKMHPVPDQSNPQAKAQTSADVRGQTTVKRRGHAMTSNQLGAGTSTSQTNASATQTTVNKEQFRARHTDVFSLGRHPKEFFVQRYGGNRVRLIGNSYFVFLDGCWVAVDVDGFAFTQRVICAGDPDFVEVVD